jgi:hypothetical protein
MAVIFAANESLADATTISELRRLKEQFGDDSVQWTLINGEFSRGLALTTGAEHVQALDDDPLLLMIDIDIVFTREAIERVRLNAIKGRQIWYPVVFR